MTPTGPGTPPYHEADRALTGWAEPRARIKSGLARGDFELYLQPIVSLESGLPEMAEVLVRLREEERLLLPPGDFIPVLEHYGLMPQLDRWVMRQAVKCGLRLRLSINVSRQTLLDDDFAGFAFREARACAVRAESIQFEIDESDLLDQRSAAELFASRMKAAGFGIVIDGFGRRSASFEPLSIVAPGVVKIDGCIVRKLLKEAGAERKLGAIVQMGQRLRFDTVAECVEEQAVLLRLKALGIRHVQGFGVGRPCPIGEWDAQAANFAA
jgi:EAL domain-containing protein (putative c-di-GMP-specific phosphodiesterase class I)